MLGLWNIKQSNSVESSYKTKQLLHSKDCDVKTMVQDRMTTVRFENFRTSYTLLIISFLNYVDKGNNLRNCKFLCTFFTFQDERKCFKLISSSKR